MSKEIFLDIPFIPKKPISLALVDSRYKARLKSFFIKNKILPIFVEKCTELYPAISCHPDIQCHPLGGNRIVIAPNASQSLKNQLIQHNFEIIVGNTRLESNYPNNIAYNVARIGRYAFHNKKFTDPILKEELQAQGVELIHVKQGYAKCSVAVVDQYSIITSDKGIAKVATEIGIKVLLINPGFIELPGLNYGFIGGATGLVSQNKLAFAGNWKDHKDYKKIEIFLKERNKTPVAADMNPLVDVGSIIPLKQYE
ncbi:MAG: hypothetical protein GX160_07940 [Clostridiales bacterium]|jgi:uncharacterized CHY-type Zn-finger protein|nr:hypothetical protein [Clostridiales bacterium]